MGATSSKAAARALLDKLSPAEQQKLMGCTVERADAMWKCPATANRPFGHPFYLEFRLQQSTVCLFVSLGTHVKRNRRERHREIERERDELDGYFSILIVCYTYLQMRTHNDQQEIACLQGI